MNYLLLFIPLLSALLGWGLVRLLLGYLTGPVRPIRFLGVSFQGIVPANQAAIAKAAGDYADEQLSRLDLTSKLTDPANFQQVKPVIESHIDHFLRHKLKEQMPMISLLIGDKTVQTLKDIFIKEIEILFPQVLQQFGNNLKTSLSVGPWLEKNIASMDPQKISTGLQTKIAPAAGKAAWLGFFIGLLVGLIQLTIALVVK